MELERSLKIPSGLVLVVRILFSHTRGEEIFRTGVRFTGGLNALLQQLVGRLLLPKLSICKRGIYRCYACCPSELMPTRIRSNCISIALVINQLGSTTLAIVFLPIASKYGYSAMFFLFAGFTIIYFITAAFFLP